MKIDITKAKCYVIADNHYKDPHYAPYCGRCPGIERMRVVEPFLWNHYCGAIHDERQVIVKETVA